MASSPENPPKGLDKLVSAQRHDDVISAGLALGTIQIAEGILGTVLGRRNCLFAWQDVGGERLANGLTILNTAIADGQF